MELEQIFGNNFSQDMIDPGFIDTELQYNDVVMWIDPIDARKTLSSDPKDITTIMGISVKGYPKAGIINKPFYHEYFGRTFVGTVESGLFYFDTNIETQKMTPAVYLPPN